MHRGLEGWLPVALRRSNFKLTKYSGKKSSYNIVYLISSNQPSSTENQWKSWTLR